jgi:very-short-patch-repair endonuclease
MTTPPPPPTPPPADADRRLNASIDHWKRSLLDLTRRNRALNFKPARVSTIVIVDEQPAEVFRQLCLKRGSLKFKPAPEPAAEARPASAPAGDVLPASAASTPVASSVSAAPPAGPTLAPTAEVAPAATAQPADATPSLASERPAAASPSGPEAAAAAPTPAAAPAGANEPGTAPANPTPSASDGGSPTASSDATVSPAYVPLAAVPAAPPAAAGNPPPTAEADSAPASAAGAEAAAELLLDEADTGPALDYVPYDRQTLDARQTDDTLQTSSTPEQLDRSLRRIDEQARLAIEEQGVNTLFFSLGMLHYKEAAESSEVFHAPLVLVPVALARKSARTGYTVTATDDDPLVNPALVEYLRRMHDLALPDLPDSAMISPSEIMADSYDLQAFFQAASAAVAGQAGWSVKTELYLALFSFQKFVMYKDLDANSDAIRQHRLAQQLVTRAGSQYLGLPAEVQALDLDRDFPPESTAQVVDADASQLRAIAASARGYDLVIEGPPGTGKSQTITNLIAQALAAGKSVLFVAEKMAALQVVYQRLVNAGLGEFCLELHSTKANKRAVMQEMRLALDASLQRPAPPGDPAAPRLPPVRQILTDYTRAAHAPAGALQLAPFHAYGELGAVLGATKLKYTGPTDNVTRPQFEQALRELQDLAVAAAPIGQPATHPWRDTIKTFYSEADLDRVRELSAEQQSRVAQVQAQAGAAGASLGRPPVQTFAQVDEAVAIASVLARSPGAPRAVVESPAWNTAPQAATTLVSNGRAFQQLQQRLSQHFTAEPLKYDHTADIAYVEQKSRGLFSFLNFLDSRYKDIERRWISYRQPAYRPSLLEQAQELKLVSEFQRQQQALAQAQPTGQQLFGALWQGAASNWEALDGYIKWIVEFRAAVARYQLGGPALELAARPHPDLTPLNQLHDSAAGAQSTLAQLRAAVGWPADYLQTQPLVAIVARVQALAGNLGLAPRWAVFETARAAAARGLAAELLPPAMTGDVPFEALGAAFRRAFLQKWLGEVVQAREPLRAFATLTHEQRVAEFRRLDERVLLENRIGLVANLREEVQRRLQEPEAAAAMPVLRRELVRQRGLSPLRQTMRQAGAAIRAIKPCFMMSPLSVAQFLDGGTPSFDLVIFDEASQLPTEDALGAIVRGKQLIVVGDPKQLPPTNFFSVMSGQASAPVGEDGLPLYEDTESVLEEYLGAGVPASRLKWHYRSLYESLIAFSNLSFYDGDLYTFPSSETTNALGGLQFEFIPDGVYEGKGLNQAEARRVADAVVEHARTHPELSLGVGTFNLRQQIAIQDELEQRRRHDPTLEPFFAERETGTFFVKNLENVQGDERDVIFISVTYAKGPDGRLRYNFGPLNSQNGWRRLNVLVTRSRRLMRVFASMHGDDINPAATPSQGPRLLREFLIYAERGRLDGTLASQAAATESPFERDVFQALTERGAALVPQVGVSGYRIDFGVEDPAAPGRFVCGLECDGVSYHASPTARDRDRLRQQVLEARGWTIYRVWSTDWFKDRAGQIEGLLGLIETARQRASEVAASQAEAEAQAQERRRQAESAAAEAAVAAKLAAPPNHGNGDYQRPAAPAYRVTPGEGRYSSDILTAPLSQVQKAVAQVVETEAPLHITDLVARVAGMWGARVGARIRARVLDALAAAQPPVTVQGEFISQPGAAVAVRSRAGTHIPPERVPPEEYRQAILTVLGTGQGFSRADLSNEVRALLGFGRATEPLHQAVEAQVSALLAEGRLGEGSAGLTLRQ